MQPQYEKMKLCLLRGSSDVRMTAILKNIDLSDFDNGDQSTANLCYYTKEVIYDNRKYYFALWDISGQTAFDQITPIYYRDAVGVVFVYNITNPKSFTKITKQIEYIMLINKTAKILILGNKIDTNNCQVNQPECIDYAKESKYLHFFISSETGFNINEAFKVFTEEIIKEKFKNSKSSVKTNKIDLKAGDNNNMKPGFKKCSS